MKHIIFLFALLFAGALTAQETADSTTTTVENRQGVFFSVTRNYYPSGRILTDEQPLGSDTLTVANFLVGSIYPDLSAFAAKAVEVARFSKQIQKINNASRSLQSLLNLSYSDVMQSLLVADFLPDSLQPVSYTMRVGANAPVSVSLRLNAAGKLVLRQGSSNFIVQIVTREWLRVLRYDGTTTETANANVRVDLFREAPNRWVSRDLNFIFTKQQK